MRIFGIGLILFCCISGASIQPGAAQKPSAETPARVKKTLLFQQAPARFIQSQAELLGSSGKLAARDEVGRPEEEKDAARTAR
jgi:hypothetical protein